MWDSQTVDSLDPWVSYHKVYLLSGKCVVMSDLWHILNINNERKKEQHFL